MNTQSKIHPLEWVSLIALLLLANVSLLWGEVRSEWLFFSQTEVGWTFLTHPFVHVSGYHLLLDAGAFLFLYHALADEGFLKRMGYTVACGAGALGVACLLDPSLKEQGLCGLSGIGHGLMAVTSLLALLNPSVSQSEKRVMGGLMLGLVAKVVFEVSTGQVFFASSHWGDVGKPVTACHAGGVLAGVIAVLLFNRGKVLALTKGAEKGGGHLVQDISR